MIAIALARGEFFLWAALLLIGMWLGWLLRGMEERRRRDEAQVRTVAELHPLAERRPSKPLLSRFAEWWVS